MDKLSKLPNIGKVMEKKLEEAGIHTPEELAAVGAKEAFLRVRLVDSGACINVLYGLEGAIEGVLDNHLPQEKKQELKEFFGSL